ncbi:MAG: threonylcarbamoyl-AMP synthase [Chloroflexi bacterium]|nr:threonylcarbamoyl-AMP synthase [Chloroflexota bacterium]
MEIVAVDADNPDPLLLRRAADLVLRGEVVVCPTDTGYALSASALDRAAIDRVFELKGRKRGNPIHVAIASIRQAEKYARLNPLAEHLARIFLPGALTMVLPRREIVPPELVAGGDTIGIRIPACKVILALAGLIGLPLTATSANISGQPATYSIEEVAAQLGQADLLALDRGPIAPREVSTIVDLTTRPPRLLRQGRIPWEVIQKALKEIKE